MKCKDCIHFPVCCISDNPNSYHVDMCTHKLLSTPKGEWIPKGRWHIDPQCIEYACSICGRRIMREESLDVIEQYPFCHCGADMRGDT